MGLASAADRKAKECPLCGLVVSGGADGMNRHFETDCPWRDSSANPGQRQRGASKPA